MIEYVKRTWAVVDLDRLDHNLREVQNYVGNDCMVMGVVKADAYGHGDQYISTELEQLGVNWFGVSGIEEAQNLRRWGIEKPILIFGATPLDYSFMLWEYQITQTVHTYSYAWELEQEAAKQGKTIRVHIKLDTGMSRLGFLVAGSHRQQSLEEIEKIANFPHLQVEGLYTHFACADEDDADSVEYTWQQFRQYEQTRDALKAKGIEFALHHCCNSAATLHYPQMHLDMVRTGIVLYGLAPSPERKRELALQSAMELYSRITMVKEIDSQTSVSYGRIFQANQTMRVATVGIGYADGYERMLSNRGRMLVHGQEAPVIGRVCMDQLMLDVTHIPQAQEGDLVTVIGRDGDCVVDFDELAEQTGSINYEKVCLIGKRVPRVYRKGGEEIGVVAMGKGKSMEPRRLILSEEE